jgi:hypothetical protein
MNKPVVTLVALVAAFVFTSCEVIPTEPTVSERRETQSNIAREQARLKRQAAAQRARAQELDNASRMSHRGAADYEPDTYEMEQEADDAHEQAEELDTASRMMGRGAAN